MHSAIHVVTCTCMWQVAVGPCMQTGRRTVNGIELCRECEASGELPCVAIMFAVAVSVLPMPAFEVIRCILCPRAVVLGHSTQEPPFPRDAVIPGESARVQHCGSRRSLFTAVQHGAGVPCTGAGHDATLDSRICRVAESGGQPLRGAGCPLELRVTRRSQASCSP